MKVIANERLMVVGRVIEPGQTFDISEEQAASLGDLVTIPSKGRKAAKEETASADESPVSDEATNDQSTTNPKEGEDQ